jgi:TRAP-type C4-dicarboxylate transport system permease small subunit
VSLMKGKKLVDLLWNIEESFLITCLGVMGLALFSQVIFRYLFKHPLIWTEELARYLQVWITFMGIGYGIRNKCHVEISLLYDKLPFTLQKIFSVITNGVVIFCFVVYFVPGAIRFILDQHLIDSSTLQIRMSIVYSVIPAGSLIVVAYLIADTYGQIKALVKMKRDISC